MPLYRFDVFELDVDLYSLSRQGKPVIIGPKPFDLLLYLIKHPGRIISKGELIKKVWNADAVSDSTIPTCITAVRRALNDDPERPKFVQTVRGRGYRFIENAILDSEIENNCNPGTSATSYSKSFVGREAEMAFLCDGFRQAISGKPQTFLLLGEAGIGKTRLIEEFAHQSATLGATVLVGRCREEEGAPAFWPWIQILRAHIEKPRERTLCDLEPYAAVISQMVPELRQLFPAITPLPDVDAEQARFRLLDGITRFLQASSTQKPLALMIDDLHHADTSSLLLLEFLVRELRDAPILILGAYRDLDILADSNRKKILTRVARTATSRSIQLKGISRRAIGKLVEQSEDGELVSALYEKSAGNPFFLTQLVQLLDVKSANLSNRSADEWRFSLPTGVKDAISSQLNELPEKTRKMLNIAAVIGREFTSALLARSLALAFSEIITLLEPAVAARLIDDVQHHSLSYRFSHALLRDVVYDQIPKHDRSCLHKMIGEALESIHEADLDACLAELAFHFAESAGAGDAGKAIAYCIAAGEQAVARLAHENASEHFSNALDLLELQEVADPRKRCELLIQLGGAEMHTGDRQGARHHLIHAANIARQLDAPELLARAALGLAPGFFTIEVGTYDPELESLLNEAKTALPKVQGDLMVQLTSRLAMAAVWSSTIESCDALSTAALNLAGDIQNPVTKAYALRARHGALWGPKRFAERRKLIVDLGKISSEVGDAEIALMYRILNVTALLEAGDMVAADREIRAYTKLATTLQLPHAEWYVGLFVAMRTLMEGRYSAAALSAKRFLEIGNRVHDQNAPQSFGAHLFLRLWEDNKLKEIFPLVEKFIAEHPMIPAWKCAALFVQSELQDPEANRHFDEFLEFGFINLPLNETWAIALHMLSHAAVNLGRVSAAQQLYDLTRPGKMHHTIVGYGVMSWGSRARELGNLASLMGRFDEATEHFELAIAQNRKTGGTPWVARSQFDYARMLAQRRDRADADRIRGLVSDARQTAQRLGMVRLNLQIADFARQF